MRRLRTAAVAGAVSLTLLAGAGVAVAQSDSPQQGRTLQVPPGAVVIVLPGAAMPGAAWHGPAVDAGFPTEAMPSPWAMMRQIDAQMTQMMQAAQRGFAPLGLDMPGWTDPQRITQASMGELPHGPGRVSEVMVTSFSDGHGTCTRRVVYPGGGAAPKVEVSDTGHACAAMHMPAATPAVQQPHNDQGVRTIQARSVPSAKHTVARPLEVAQLGD